MRWQIYVCDIIVQTLRIPLNRLNSLHADCGHHYSVDGNSTHTVVVRWIKIYIRGWLRVSAEDVIGNRNRKPFSFNEYYYCVCNVCFHYLPAAVAVAGDGRKLPGIALVPPHWSPALRPLPLCNILWKRQRAMLISIYLILFSIP